MTEVEMDRLTAELPTKSQKIRLLHDHGVSRSAIAKYLNIRYQHVRNVVIAPRPKGAAPNAGPTAANGAALTIDEAKRGLSMHFGVPIDAIEITIRG